MPIVKLLRLHAPAGIWLLLWPCLWSITLASKGQEFPWLIVLYFAAGAVVMRSFGCVVNDLWDRELDAQVERTRTRPLASGAISVKQAYGILMVLGVLGLVILLQLNRPTIYLGLAVIPLILLYPLMKRLTYWPQLFLGLTFNWGALMGWSAVEGRVALPALILYGAALCWTLAYDTIYAFQDLQDDVLVGIKSSAQRVKNHPKWWVGLFYTGFFLGIAILECVSGSHYHSLGMLWVAIGMVIYGLVTWEITNPAAAGARFYANIWIGWVIWAGMLIIK